MMSDPSARLVLMIGADLAEDPNMTQEERAARLLRIQEANRASNRRVHDFVDMFASMCASRTRARKERASLTPVSAMPMVYDTDCAEAAA